MEKKKSHETNKEKEKQTNQMLVNGFVVTRKSKY